MSKATFTIAYDGPALLEHSVDVRTLAPALLGFGELIDAANEVLNGKKVQTRTNVRALESGSFQVSFEVIESRFDQFVTLFSGAPVTAAINLLTLLGFTNLGITGVIATVKWLKGKNPESVEEVDKDTVRLSCRGKTIDISLNCLKLLENRAVRTSLHRIIEEPLSLEGIDSFEVRENGKASVSIKKDEASYFARPSVHEEILIDDHRQSAFSIVSLTFKEDNKWKLHDGSNTISATIKDQEFLTKVDNSEVAFAKGDVLVCDVHIVQKQTASGLRTEYNVERVVKFIPGSKQLPFDFS